MLIYNCQKEMKTLERALGGNKNESNEKSRNG